MRDAMRIHEVNRGRQMRVNEGNGSLSRFFTRLDLLCQPFEQILRYIFAKQHQMRGGIVNGFEASTNGRRLDPEVDVTFQLLQVVRRKNAPVVQKRKIRASS